MKPRAAVFRLILGLGMLVAPHAAHAQQTGKVPRIGFLGPTSEAGLRAGLEAFRWGLPRTVKDGAPLDSLNRSG